MSKFYGQVIGSAITSATRRGAREIKVSAQSWGGSIQTRLYYSPDNELKVEISTYEGSSATGDKIFDGTFEEFKAKLKN